MGRETVEQIKNALPALETLAKPINAVKRGKDLQGAHPIHGSTTGNNFVIHTDSQTWHCFRCGSHGDVLNWIAVEEKLVTCEDASEIADVFTEVLEIAAERTGISLNMGVKDKAEIRKLKAEKETLQKGFRKAQEYFKSNLTPEVRQFIKEKWGFDDAIIEKYEIGYAPPKENGLAEVLFREIGEMAYASGLLVNLGPRYIDLFQGRVTFPYKHRGEYNYFISRQTKWTPNNQYESGKYKKQLVGDNHDYVSKTIRNSLYGLDSIRGEDTVIVAEGITDAISAMELGYPTVSPVTVRFKREDIEAIRDYVKGKNVLVCNDADDAGFRGALDTLELIENTQLVLMRGEGLKDINDMFRELGRDKCKEKFDAMVAKSVPRMEALAMYSDDENRLFYPALLEIVQDPDAVRRVWNKANLQWDTYNVNHILDGLTSLKDKLAVFRRTDKHNARAPTAIEEALRKRIISGVVRRHLHKSGEFLWDEKQGKGYYFNRNTHVVYELPMTNGSGAEGGDEFCAQMDKEYGLSKADKEGQFAIQQLRDHAIRDGRRIEARKYFFYDKFKNVLYIHDRRDHFFVLDAGNDEKDGQIKKMPNGTDGIFFVGRSERTINYLPEGQRKHPDEAHGQIDEWDDEGDFIHEILVNRTNFVGKTALTARQQRLQWMITMYMFPFAKFFSAKPIIAFVGQKGSGKTVTMRMMGKFLINPDYEVAALPEERDFLVVAANEPLYFLDNVDQSKRWVNDMLACVATGVAIKERALYTNTELSEAKIECFLGLNARTPQFKRDDVVDRLLLFYVDRFESNLDPGVLFDPITEYWDTLWSEYLDHLSRIVRAFAVTDTASIRSNHRLIGWVVFANVVAKALNIQQRDLDDLIEAMKYEKSAFALQDDVLYPALVKFTGIEQTREWWTASELWENLCHLDPDFQETYKSPKSISRRLANLVPELHDLVNLTARFNKGKKVMEYGFGKGLPARTLSAYEGAEADEPMHVADKDRRTGLDGYDDKGQEERDEV